MSDVALRIVLSFSLVRNSVPSTGDKFGRAYSVDKRSNDGGIFQNRLAG